MSTHIQHAEFASMQTDGKLTPLFTGPQPIKMHISQGTAKQLLYTDKGPKPFGLDLIRFAPGEGVANHTHPGAHILLCMGGKGILMVRHISQCDAVTDEYLNITPGVTYLVESNSVHSVYADKESELLLLVIGSDHRKADAVDRLTPKN